MADNAARSELQIIERDDVGGRYRPDHLERHAMIFHLTQTELNMISSANAETTQATAACWGLGSFCVAFVTAAASLWLTAAKDNYAANLCASVFLALAIAFGIFAGIMYRVAKKKRAGEESLLGIVRRESGFATAATDAE